MNDRYASADMIIDDGYTPAELCVLMKATPDADVNW